MTVNATFDQIFLFGDSLTDTGVIFDLTSQVLEIAIPPESVGYGPQFSDGATYAAVSGELLGADVVNFAVGGAKALGNRTLDAYISDNGLGSLLKPDASSTVLDTVIDLDGQVGRFAASLTPGEDLSGSAASIFIGLNDLNAFAPTSPETAGAEAAALIGGVITSAITAGAAAVNAGVGTVIYHTLPDASFFPSFQFADPLIQALAGQVVDGYNANLVAASAQLELLGAEVEIVDLNALADRIADDPSDFGFVAPLDQPRFLGTGGDPVIIDTPDGPAFFFLANPALAGLDADEVAFMDFLHPTAALHGIMGAFSEASLTSNAIFLEDGRNLAAGTASDDLLLGGADTDRANLGDGDDVALGSLGDDRLAGAMGSDLISGGAGDDIVRGGGGEDVVAGGAGDDLVRGGGGSDLILDGAGSDIAEGGAGRDYFLYQQGDAADADLFDGGSGYDTLFLVLSGDALAGVKSQLADTGGIDGAGYAFDAIGLETTNIEKVILLSDPSDVVDRLHDDLGARAMEADLWALF